MALLIDCKEKALTKPLLAIIALSTAGAIGLHMVPPPVACAANAAAEPVGSRADAACPALVELCQSQGCSSCPPALAVLDQVANRPDVLALNFAVIYWQQLGWKDTALIRLDRASVGLCAGARTRQRPDSQVIVNGRTAVLGSYAADVDRASAAHPCRGGPAIVAEEGSITAASGAAAKPAIV